MAKGTVNSVTIVGHIASVPIGLPTGNVRCAIVTQEIVPGGKAYETTNIIEASDDILKHKLTRCTHGQCVAITGRLATTKNDKGLYLTRVMLDTFERCVDEPPPRGAA